MFEFLENVKNRFDFRFRQITKLSRKNYFEETENVIVPLECAHLATKYDLDFLKQNSTNQNFYENLYTLDIFDKYFSIKKKDALRTLDIGSKNWSYAKAEYVFFKKYCKSLYMSGVELDAYRLYSNLYSRYEVAKFYIKGIPNVQYLAQNLLHHDKTYDYITWILPFVSKKPHMKWGLPLKYFEPEKLLAHAYKLLVPNGKMFIVNQCIEEYEMQLEMIQKLGLPYRLLDEIKSPFSRYKNRRYGVLVYKND